MQVDVLVKEKEKRQATLKESADVGPHLHVQQQLSGGSQKQSEMAGYPVQSRDGGSGLKGNPLANLSIISDNFFPLPSNLYDYNDFRSLVGSHED